MNTRDALFRAILNAPDDDLPRLIYADWLEENGEGERAHFIRNQIEIAKWPEWDRRFLECDSEAVNGYKLRYEENLLAGLREVHFDPTGYRRGFPNHLYTKSITDLLNHAEVIWSRMPLESIEILDTSIDAWLLLVNSPWMQKVRKLQSMTIPLNEQTMRPFLESPHTHNLRVFDSNNSPTTPDGIRALLSSALLTKLNELHLWLRRDLGGTLAELCQYVPAECRLQVLRLRANGMKAENLRVVLDTPLAAGLRELNVDFNPIGDAGCVVLSNAKALAGLETLRMLETNMRIAGIRALSQSPYLTQLRELGLWHNELGPSAAKLIAESPVFSKLTVLRLRKNKLADSGAAAIAQSTTIKALAELDLSGNRITDAGAKELLDSPLIRNLTRLHLGENKFSPRMEKRLREQFGNRLRL